VCKRDRIRGRLLLDHPVKILPITSWEIRAPNWWGERSRDSPSPEKIDHRLEKFNWLTNEKVPFAIFLERVVLSSTESCGKHGSFDRAERSPQDRDHVAPHIQRQHVRVGFVTEQVSVFLIQSLAPLLKRLLALLKSFLFHLQCPHERGKRIVERGVFSRRRGLPCDSSNTCHLYA